MGQARVGQEGHRLATFDGKSYARIYLLCTCEFLEPQPSCDKLQLKWRKGSVLPKGVLRDASVGNNKTNSTYTPKRRRACRRAVDVIEFCGLKRQLKADVDFDK